MLEIHSIKDNQKNVTSNNTDQLIFSPSPGSW